MNESTNNPSEHQEIRDLISKGKYEETVQRYYDTLGSRFYGELHSELIYLKRLGRIPLIGRDLMYFRTEATRNELIRSNLKEYCGCIDKAIEHARDLGLQQPLDILLDNAPTMEELIEQRKRDWHDGVYLRDGICQRDTTPVTMNSFSAQYDKIPAGRLFDRYPDQIQYCRVIEAAENRAYKGLWVSYSPSYYQKQILDQSLHLNQIDAYTHKEWRWDQRKPDFVTVTSMTEITKSDYVTRGLRYTGRSHTIQGVEFFEIDLVRPNPNGKNFCVDWAIEHENPFIEVVEDILREAENILREKHHLPRIGEGWVSEMQLYHLVRSIFPEAQHHASPEWLKPMHFDIFVPSKQLAFEYQGKQHFEPVDFFGGERAFHNTQIRDQEKKNKCGSAGVTLVEWRYDESIQIDILQHKLKSLKFE